MPVLGHPAGGGRDPSWGSLDSHLRSEEAMEFQGPLQNGNGGPLLKKLLIISRGQQQRIKPSNGSF